MTKFRVKNPRPGDCKINLVDQRFGKLVVIKYEKNNKQQNKLWRCRCDCGKETLVTTTGLRSGHTTSCKCNQYKKGSDVYNYTGYKDITGTRWYAIKNGAESRGLSFKITKKKVFQLLVKQGYKCALTGLPVSFKDNTASVDRIDNSKGYTMKNVMVTHQHVNLMRNKFSVDYFKQICKLVVDNGGTT